MVFGNKTNKKSYKKNNKIFRKMSASKLVAKKRRSNLVKLIKDIQIGNSEMKYKSGTATMGNALHNNIYQIHAWSSPGTGTNLDIMPGQGVNDTTRIGDRIYIEGIKLRCSFQTVGDRLNTKIKVFYIPHNSEQGDP